MQTVDAIFDALGGPAEIGRIIGKSTEHASSMKRRGSIPVDYWPRLAEAAFERGLPITYETLVQVHTASVEAVD